MIRLRICGVYAVEFNWRSWSSVIMKRKLGFLATFLCNICCCGRASETARRPDRATMLESFMMAD